jgi:malonyl-CoA/methylmalonyl-CoA synthetase
VSTPGGRVSAEEWSRAGWRAHLPGVGDPGAVVREFGARTIPELAAESARRAGGRLAVAVDGERVTHAELDADAARVAGWLAGRIKPGDRVLLAAGSSLGFLRCYLGALRAGAVVVLAGPAATAAELGQVASASGAVVAFADPGAARRLSGLPVVGTGDLAAVLASGSEEPVIRARPQDTALLAFTSGTTGRPKGVPLTHGALATSIRSAMAAWRWTGDDVLVHALPLHHQHGLGGVHATLIAGSSAHLLAKFSAARLIGVMGEAGASVLFGVPTTYQALADVLRPPGQAAGAAGGADEAAPAEGAYPAGGAAGGAAGPVPAVGGAPAAGGAPATGDTPAGAIGAASAEALRGLRLAVCGSAPLSSALADRLRPVLGMPPLVRYGTTETGLDVSNPVTGARGDTLGLPLPGVLCRVRSGDADAPAGTDGEIQLRGPQVFGGYWQDPEATAAAFTADGWFRTGDIGCIDPGSGHLVIRGRIKELIITGGMNVHPREVELVLERHPSVAEAVVAGVPDGKWGEQVTAWVVLRPGHPFDEEGLIAHARAVLSAYKCPKRVYELDSVPRNDLGKVLRGVLTAGAC